MKQWHAFLIIVLIGLVASLGTAFFYVNHNYYEVREIPMQIEVAEKLGFNVDPYDLNFGANSPDNTVKRFLTLSFPKRTKVFVLFEGEMEDWIAVDDNAFVLEAGEERELAFEVLIPKDTEYGKYSGTARFIFKRA